MTTESLARILEEALAEILILDIHTHLVGGKLGAVLQATQSVRGVNFATASLDVFTRFAFAG